MGRIRTVKPELFMHEGLFDAEVETGLPLRLAFIGLFTCCDREGRFRWRPRQLKTDIMPYDEIDFARVLDALLTRGFIVRYACSTREQPVNDGFASGEYGMIPTFKSHQLINSREKPSTLPAPSKINDIDACSTRAPRQHGNAHVERERERERKNSVAVCGANLDSLAHTHDQNFDSSKTEQQERDQDGSTTETPSQTRARILSNVATLPARPGTGPTPSHRMTTDWQPQPDLLAAMCITAGVDSKIISAGALFDFKYFWSDRLDQLTEQQWISRLIKSAKRFALTEEKNLPKQKTSEEQDAEIRRVLDEIEAEEKAKQQNKNGDRENV